MHDGPVLVDVVDDDGRRRRMVIRLDDRVPVPPYEQLRAQLSVMVAVGLLEPGARLPTIRSLADTLALAPGTVARTYAELERDGVVVARGRRGTFVADEPPVSEPLEERRRRLGDAAARFVDQSRQLGVPVDEAVAAVHAAFATPERG